MAHTWREESLANMFAYRSLSLGHELLYYVIATNYGLLCVFACWSV
jgi:hypothetical protein